MSIRNLLLAVPLILLMGCAAMKDKTVVSTGTVLGAQVAENQGTGMYEAKLGYSRIEFVMCDTNNAEILMEFKTSGLFSFSSNGGIYQRLAIGRSACANATPMFLKNRLGNYDTNSIIEAVDIVRKFNSQNNK